MLPSGLLSSFACAHALIGCKMPMPPVVPDSAIAATKNLRRVVAE
jgi:hypothetical protein